LPRVPRPLQQSNSRRQPRRNRRPQRRWGRRFEGL